MCVACDLLTGLDLDDIAAATPGPWRLHLPDGGAGVALDQPLPSALRAVPVAPSNRHYAPARPPAEAAAAWLSRARQDYEHYRAAAAAGRIEGGVRFLVCVPSPFTWLGRTASPEDVAGALPGMEQALAAGLAELAAAVPPADLALQWDLAAETALWESRGRDLTAGRKLAPRVLEGLVRLAEAWPAEAELGFHLCRREVGGEWAADPLDAAQVSHLAGALLASLDRTVAFLHLPGARGAAEPEWYAPLSRLAAWQDTALHVGLAWDDDPAARVAARIEACQVLLPRAHAAPACCARPVAARLALDAARRDAHSGAGSPQL